MTHLALRPPPVLLCSYAPVLLCSCVPVLLCSCAVVPASAVAPVALGSLSVTVCPFLPALVVPPSITYTDKFLATDISGMVDGLVVALVVGSPNGSGFESQFRQVQNFFSELVNNKKNRPL